MYFIHCMFRLFYYVCSVFYVYVVDIYSFYIVLCLYMFYMFHACIGLLNKRNSLSYPFGEPSPKLQYRLRKVLLWF